MASGMEQPSGVSGDWRTERLNVCNDRSLLGQGISLTSAVKFCYSCYKTRKQEKMTIFTNSYIMIRRKMQQLCIGWLIIVNLITVLVSIAITWPNWSNVLRLWIHIKYLTSTSFHLSIQHRSALWNPHMWYDMSLLPNKFWLNKVIHRWNPVS